MDSKDEIMEDKPQMGLIERTLNSLKKNRQNILDGNINCIPSPFVRFRKDFAGCEHGSYILITSFTKGGKTQFASNLLFEALVFAHHNPEKAKIKVLWFGLEEKDERVVQRFMSWLLFRLDGIRISPKQLRSIESAIPQRILDLLESPRYMEYLQAFEDSFIISTTSNPTGIYKECKKFAMENGTVLKKKVEFSESEVFDRFVYDPTMYVFAVIDHASLVDTESGLNKKDSMDKMSVYLSRNLRNRFDLIPIIIQQQNTDAENNESFKLGRLRPSIRGLADTKYTARDCNYMFGIFSPFRFELPAYNKYDITKFRDHIRFVELCAARDDEMGAMIALFFDGATCYWHELPDPRDTAALERIYRYIELIDSPNPNFNSISNPFLTPPPPSNRIFSLLLFNKLFKSYRKKQA